METPGSVNNTVSNNYIGTNAAGTAALPNLWGITSSHPLANVITGNLISGNIAKGIYLNNGANGDVVTGNRIGTTANGLAALPNDTGIEFADTAGNMTIGGPLLADRNIISGNTEDGIFVLSSVGAAPNTIRGNWIGLDATGATTLANGRKGIETSSPDMILGNVVSANQNGGGVAIFGHANGAIVRGNKIGTDSSGTNVGQTGAGIIINDVTGVVVGGSAAGEGNTIVHNDVGIWLIGASGTIVKGNTISSIVLPGAGPAAADSTGIHLQGGSSNSIFGGTQPGEGNTIAFNGTGIQLTDTAGLNNAIRGNSIHSNGSAVTHLGINLGNVFAVTANDVGDVDTGPNGLQNFPLPTAAVVNTSNKLVVFWTIATKPLVTLSVDFFVSPTCDASGHGEGKIYVGTTALTTNALGNQDGSSSQFDNAVATYGGQFVTMTATTAEGTSEFSPCMGIGSICPAPASSTLVVGASGVIWCRADFSLIAPVPPPAPLPDSVTAAFEWNNAGQLFKFWFRGFPDGFQTLTQVSQLHHYFFQSSQAGVLANAPSAFHLPGPGTPLAPITFTATPAGAYGTTWAGTDHAMTSLTTYLPGGITAMFNWSDAGQLFKFWFRGFPDSFQTMTGGLLRGSFYFFQGTGGVVVNVD